MEKLKYLSFALLIALCAGFVSCSDDEDDEPDGGGNGSGIVGMWQGVTSDNYYKENGNIIEQGTAEDVSGVKFNFKSDGTFNIYEYDGEGEWFESPAGTWDYSAGILTLYYPWDDEVPMQSAKVLELSGTTLVLEYTETGYYDGVTYEDYEKLTLRRI